MIGGLETPDSGAVLQMSEPPANSLNPLTYIFQDFALLPWRSVHDNVALVLEGQPTVSRSEREAIIADVLARTKLTGFEKAWPRQLSGGMKQRVAIARVLANSPVMLLMDEPFGALDAQTRILLQELLLDVWRKEKTTILFITHDIDEAILLADNVYIMSSRPGRIKAKIPITIPRPRDHKATVTPEFSAVKSQIMDLLWEEIQQS